MTQIEIEIDGKRLAAEPNQTVIQVADAAGIYIPRFCYHKHLSIPANCRMCLVEVEKSPKALPACATPVMAGMKVFTRSHKAVAAQRAVMEFLLINHPLDCPVCDQGGECDLQDLSMGYGESKSHYNECKRSIADQDLGPLIATEMTRCIECTRCVRFGTEIAGLREMGQTYRGEKVEIGTYIQQAVTSEVSGNIIDLCPVGALTSKPFRFTARAWELEQAPSISPHDCLGSHVSVHTRYGKVMRVVSREHTAINETWISDRDRFAYAGLYHENRLEEPMAKIDGKWQAIGWQEALELAANKLKETITSEGVDKFGALASPNSTVEELYLLQKIVRDLGGVHIDHRLREIDTRDQANQPLFPSLGKTLTQLAQSDAIVLIGSNIQKEQPLAAIRIRKAIQQGATVVAINPIDYQFHFAVHAKSIVAPQYMAQTLAAVIRALNPALLPDWDVTVDETAQQIAQQLKQKQNACIILGALALHHHEAAVLRYLAHVLAEACGATVGMLTPGANAAGAWVAGAVPHRQAGGAALHQPGLDAYQMLHKPRKAYLLLNVEPDLDCANAKVAKEALRQAQCVVALSLYRNPVLDECADVILPIAPFTETAGTFINAFGEWQGFNGVANAYGASRPAWKVLRVLANFLQLDGYAYESAEEVKQELLNLIEKSPAIQAHIVPQSPKATEKMVMRVGEIPMYASDNIVRHSQPLQSMQALTCDMSVVRMSAETAYQCKLQAGDTVRVKQSVGEAVLPIVIDERVPIDAVWVMGGVAATKTLGDLFGKVEMSKC